MGRRFDDCVTEDLGEGNLDNMRHPYTQGQVRTPVGEGTGVHIGWGWCSIDHEYVGRWGECYSPTYAPTALNGGDTSAQLLPNPHALYWSPQSCIVEVLPRCAGREGGDVVTIIGRNFVSDTTLSTNFSIGSENVPGSVTYVSHKELQAVVPTFTELTKTTQGLLYVMSKGKAVRFCSDVATNDAKMHVPQFTIQGVEKTFYVADSLNHRVHVVDYETGLTNDRRSSEWRSGGLQNPMGMDIGPDGALYVASSGTDEILRYDTQNFYWLGKFADVPGEPRGLRWKGNDLFVVSCYKKRVLRFKHAFSSLLNKTVTNIRNDQRGRQAVFAGYFTQDMNGIYLPNQKEAFDHPNELMFHAVDGELKLFVTSSHAGCVLQFNGITGTYERVFTDVPINMLSSLAFSYRGFNRDLFVSSPFAGTSFGRFDGTTGRFKGVHTDISIRRPKGLLVSGDTLLVSDREAVRTFDINSGAILHDVATIPASRLGTMSWDMQCHADRPYQV